VAAELAPVHEGARKLTEPGGLDGLVGGRLPAGASTPAASAVGLEADEVLGPPGIGFGGHGVLRWPRVSCHSQASS